MPKSETRALATRFGLAVADKPDSQDICFVPNGDYASVVQKLRPEAVEAGDVLAVMHMLGADELTDEIAADVRLILNPHAERTEPAFYGLTGSEV